MKLVAIEASTETLSLAVQVDHEVRTCEMAGGANASSNLLPELSRLVAEMGLSWGQLDAVVWGRGPGSFTGLRTACAVAQGIGFAHDLPLLGVDSVAACAQQASRSVEHEGDWVVALDARMHEVYLARFGNGQWRNAAAGACELLRPEDVVLKPGDLLCGNAAQTYPVLQNAGCPHAYALPTACAMLELAPQLIKQSMLVGAEEALPLYVRNKVAQTTAERAQNKR
jgi:tRNA threonylcarbamoyladenosine biosynthesis protein TsaB